MKKDFWNRYQFIFQVVLLVVSIFISFISVEILAGTEFFELSYSVGFANFLCYLVIYGLILCICKSIKYTIMSASLVCFVIGLINHFVVTFRGIPILPSDFYSIRTAANVAGNYKYKMTAPMAWGIVLLLAICLAAGFLKNYRWKQTLKNNILALVGYVVLASGILFCFFKTDFLENSNVYTYPWAQKHAYSKCGFMASFVANIQYIMVEKPEGYSARQAEEDLKSRDNTAFDRKVEGGKPNIIVIMNESLSDLSVLGEIKTNEEVMPFIQNMKENTVRGNLYVSAFGGNTCNTEFEFLTGNTLGFLPSGCVPYQQYIKRSPYDNLTTILTKQGYQNVAMHPYYSNGWNRNTVYPMLGFSEFLDLNDFPKNLLYRNYVSDQSDFEQVIEEYEKRKQDGPLYIFNVTMQNHSGYGNGAESGFVNNIQLMNHSNYNAVEEYLSLVQLTDKAFQSLIAYFDKVKEPTIIVLFGDHQPGIPTSFYTDMLGGEESTWSIETLQKKYTVPFRIWANYNIEEKDMGTISANYLSSVVLQEAGIPLPAYNQFLLHIMKEIPAINANGYLGNNGVNYRFQDESPYKEAVLQYNRVQYNNMFDTSGRLEELFSE